MNQPFDSSPLPDLIGDSPRMMEIFQLLERVIPSDVPVLIQPDNTEFPDTVRNVLVAWNESTEALRAVKMALPMLRRAENVNITIVDPPKDYEAAVEVGTDAVDRQGHRR